MLYYPKLGNIGSIAILTTFTPDESQNFDASYTDSTSKTFYLDRIVLNDCTLFILNDPSLPARGKGEFTFVGPNGEEKIPVDYQDPKVKTVASGTNAGPIGGTNTKTVYQILANEGEFTYEIKSKTGYTKEVNHMYGVTSLIPESSNDRNLTSLVVTAEDQETAYTIYTNSKITSIDPIVPLNEHFGSFATFNNSDYGMSYEIKHTSKDGVVAIFAQGEAPRGYAVVTNFNQDLNEQPGDCFTLNVAYDNPLGFGYGRDNWTKTFCTVPFQPIPQIPNNLICEHGCARTETFDVENFKDADGVVHPKYKLEVCVECLEAPPLTPEPPAEEPPEDLCTGSCIKTEIKQYISDHYWDNGWHPVYSSKEICVECSTVPKPEPDTIPKGLDCITSCKTTSTVTYVKDYEWDTQQQAWRPVLAQQEICIECEDQPPAPPVIPPRGLDCKDGCKSTAKAVYASGYIWNDQTKTYDPVYGEIEVCVECNVNCVDKIEDKCDPCDPCGECYEPCLCDPCMCDVRLDEISAFNDLDLKERAYFILERMDPSRLKKFLTDRKLEI